jgi:hypothetical protein
MHATRRTTRFESADVEVRARRNGYGLAHETFKKKYSAKFTRFVTLRLWLIEYRSFWALFNGFIGQTHVVFGNRCFPCKRASVVVQLRFLNPLIKRIL